jgi:hypothetical protein
MIGTVLGGSSLVRPPKGVNYYLSMRGQNESWLMYKMAEMPDYFGNSKLCWYTNTYRCNSCCSEALTRFQEKVYVGNKRNVTMEILNPLRDIGIAVWYLDSGSRTGRSKKNAYINTTKFGEAGTKVVHQYFNEVDMPCNVNRDGDRLKVLFTVSGTEALIATIGHCVPEFMLDRI